MLNLQVHMKKAQDIQLDFAEIGSDNIIDENERPGYEKCLRVTSSLIGSAISVIVAPKKKSALAATSTDSRT